MGSRVSRIDAGVGVSFVVSAVIHVAVFLLFIWWGRLFLSQTVIQETYYVDVVTLPTANPQAGSSAQQPEEDKTAPLPAPAPRITAPPPMAAPITPVKPVESAVLKTVVKSVKPAVPEAPAESESAFAERMAKLERKSEARREEAVLEKLRNKVKSVSSKNGAPGGSGAEVGSRYADYVKSRLEDALKVTSSYTTKKPEVAVRLVIAADGKLLRVQIERSSGDATFELAVRRAIDLASEKFTAPPNHAVFENGFVFKPKGIN